MTDQQNLVLIIDVQTILLQTQRNQNRNKVDNDRVSYKQGNLKHNSYLTYIFVVIFETYISVSFLEGVDGCMVPSNVINLVCLVVIPLKA